MAEKQRIKVRVGTERKRAKQPNAFVRSLGKIDPLAIRRYDAINTFFKRS
jgi:hypothetical protein